MHAYGHSQVPYEDTELVSVEAEATLICPATRRHFLVAALPRRQGLVACPNCSEMHVWDPRRQTLTRFPASAACG
jgi:hypothetical protein